MDEPSVVLPGEPRKRKTRTIVAIAVAAALAIGGGVAFALIRESDDAATFSIANTAAATNALKSYRFTMTSGARGVVFEGEGEFDQVNGLLHVVISSPDETGLSQLELIIELETQVTYINRSFFGDGAPFDTEWLRRGEFAEGSPLPPELFTRPLAAIALIEQAVLVEDLGSVLPDRVTPLQVEGVNVNEYRVTVTAEVVAEANPQLVAQLEANSGHLPDEVLYHFFVDERNIARRIYVEFKTSRLGEYSTNVTLVSINEPLQFELPAEDDVTDIADIS